MEIGTTLNLAVDLRLADRIIDFLSQLPGDSQKVSTDSVSTDPDGAINMSGAVMGEWLLPGFRWPLYDIRAKVRVSPPTDNLAFDSLNLDAKVKIRDKEFSLRGFVSSLNDIVLVFEDSSALSQIPLPLFESVTDSHVGLIPVANQSINNGVNAYRLVVGGHETKYYVQQHLTVVFDTSHLPALKNHLGDVHLELIRQDIRDRQGNERYALSWNAFGQVVLDQAYEVRVTPYFNSLYHINITIGDNGFLNPSGLSEYFGLTLLTEAIEKVAEAIPFLEHVELNGLSMVVSATEAAFKEATVRGTIALDNYRFDFSVSFPHLIFRCALSFDTPIPIGRLINHLFGNGSGLPGGMMVTSLETSLMVDPVQLRMKLVLTDLWQFQLGTTPLKLEEVEFAISKGVQAHCIIGARLRIGILDFALFASNETSTASQGWLFETQIAHEVGVSLREVISELAHLFHFETPSDIPDISLHDIDLKFHTLTHEFSISGRATLEHPLGPINQGNLSIAINLWRSDAAGHGIQVELRGGIEIDNNTLTFWADAGHPDWFLSTSWRRGAGDAIHLLKLAELPSWGITFDDIPEDVDKALSVVAIQAEYRNENKTFSSSVSTEGGEHVVLAISGAEDNKGFLLGIGYQKTEDLPQQEDSLIKEGIQKITETIELDNIWFLVNTFENGATKLRLPDEFPHDLDPSALGKGFAAMATLKLDGDHEHEGLQQLKEHLPSGELTFLATASQKEDGTKGVSLKASLRGEVTIPTGQGNHLTLQDCYLKFSWYGSHIGLQLEGTMHFTLDHVPITTVVGLDVDEHGADVRIKLEFDEGWKLFGLDQVILDELDLLVGVGFEPPGVELGLQGAMHLEGEEAKADKLGVVLEFVGEIPNPEYFALSVKEINLSRLLAMFAGGSAHGNSQVSNTLKGSNLSVYWAERALTLPDGTTARPGFGLHGEFNILGWKAYAHLDAHTDTGISGHAETAPINWHILKLSGNGQGVYGHEYWNETAGTWMRIDNTGSKELPEHTRTRTVELVPPGGPMIHFDSNVSPFIAVSIHAQLFGLVSSELDMEVTDQGFDFNLHFEVPHITKLRLECQLSNGNNFAANGSFFAGLDFDIETIFGDIDIELGIYADLDLAIGESLSDFVLALEGGIDVMGIHIPFARVNMSNPPHRLEQVPLWLAMHFAESVFPPFHDLFQDAYDELDKLPAEFDEQKYKNAVKLRDMAREWAAFVHADIQEIQSERGLDPRAANRRATVIEGQAIAIKADGEQHVLDVQKTGTSEQSRLQTQTETIKSTGLDNRQASDAQRQLRIDRMLREIKDLTDSEGLLKNAVEGIFNEHQADLESAESLVKEARDMQTKNNSLVNVLKGKLLDANSEIGKAKRAVKAADNKIMDVLRKYPPGADKKAVAQVQARLKAAKKKKAAAEKQVELAITDKRRLEKEITKATSDLVKEPTRALTDVNDKIKKALDALKLDPADDVVYPDILGKYTPTAVDHFAVIVSTRRRGALQEALIMQEARRQARTVLDRAHTTARSISLTQNT